MRKLAYAAFSFAAAVFISEYLLPHGFAVYSAVLCAFIALFGHFFRGNKRLKIYLITLGMAVGFLYCSAYDFIFVTPNDIYDGTDETAVFTVSDFPEEMSYGLRLEAKFKNSAGRNVKTRLYLYYDLPEDIKPGDTLTLPVKFSSSNVFRGEETDVFRSKGILLFAYQRGSPEINRTGRINPTYYPRFIAKALKTKIAEIFPENAVGFITAIMTGDTSLLYDDQASVTALKISGIYHVVAVSGMHVSFLVGFCLLITGNKRRGAKVIFPLLLLYMAIAGFRPSIVRAVIMQIILISGLLLNRESDGITSLSAALLVLLLQNPTSSKDAGLQMSFAVTLGIILITPRLNAHFEDLISRSSLNDNKMFRRIFSYVASAVSASAGAFIFTAPLIAVYYGYLSLVSPLTNILVLWAVSVVFCTAIVSCALGFIFTPLGAAAGYLVSFLIRYILFVAKTMASFRFSAVYMSNPLVLIWATALFVSVYILIFKRAPLRKYIIPLCSFSALLCVILVISYSVFLGGRLRLISLDVGQGASSLIVSGGYTVMVDCGSSGGDNAGDVAADYLHAYGGNRVDIVILTHYDKDHINGISQLLLRMDVGLIMMPRPDYSDLKAYDGIISAAADAGAETVEIISDVTADIGDAQITVFAPIGVDSSNERGLSVLYSLDGYDILITGDMRSAVEKKLIEKANMPDIEVLVVGHHGSKYSTSEELLDSLKPETAVISVGYNSYGHPSDEVIKRLEDRKIEVFRTDRDGTVVITAEN